MKHLPYFIFESLFDTDLTSNSFAADEYLWNTEDSELWKFLQIRKFASAGDQINRHSIIINEPVTISNTGKDTIIKNPLGEKYDFTTKQLLIKTRSDVDIKDNLGFKSIKVDGELMIYAHDGNMNMENCEFTIGDGIPKIDSIDRIKFKNVSINFEQDDIKNFIIFHSIFNSLNIKGLSSNTRMLLFYGAGMFDTGMKSEFDSFFGKEPIILNDGTKKNKSTRNIMAIINNLKKYGALDPINYKPVKKLTDLIDIDLNKFENLERIKLKNNNVEMTFVNFRKNSIPNINAIKKYASYVRFNNITKYRDYDLGEMVELVKQCVTPDGWVLLLEKI